MVIKTIFDLTRWFGFLAMYNENLKRLKDDIAKNENTLSKKEREDELNVHLDVKKRLMMTIEDQMKKIQRLIGELQFTCVILLCLSSFHYL